MVDEVIDATFFKKAKNAKKIKNFKDLRIEITNLLMYFEYELPIDFNLIKIPDLLHKHQLMSNFSKSHSYLENISSLSTSLKKYFKMEYGGYEKEKNQITPTLGLESIQTFDSILSPELVNLVSNKNSLISKVEHNSQELTEIEPDLINTEEDILSSENIPEIQNDVLKDDSNIDTPELLSESENKTIGDATLLDEIESLEEINKGIDFSKSFNLEEKSKQKASESSDSILDDTLELLGFKSFGLLKRGIKKKIITEKKQKQGLNFDEWVSENKIWVKSLLLASNNLESLNLEIETRLLAKTSDFFINNPDLFKYIDQKLEIMYQRLFLI